MPERKILAENIVKFRKKYHLSQYEMAAECDISIEVLSLIEREVENPRLYTLQKIAAFMGNTVAEMLSKNEREAIILEITYRIEKQKLSNDDTESYTAYGVSAVSIRGNEVIIIKTISDIFLHYEQAKEFVHMCNKHKLLIEHFDDMVNEAIDYLHSA